MPTLPAALTFASVAFLMALSPGPNLLYLASRSICQGKQAGFASLAGVCTGMLIYMLATAAGLSTLFMAVPLAYDVVRCTGAAYLLWLAYKAFTGRAPELGTAQLRAEPPSTLFRTGFFTCLFNPKLVITYGSLLPQFIEPANGHVLGQTVALGLIQIGAAATAHSCVIVLAAGVSGFLTTRVKSLAALQRYLLSTVLAGLALRLALDRRHA